MTQLAALSLYNESEYAYEAEQQAYTLIYQLMDILPNIKKIDILSTDQDYPRETRFITKCIMEYNGNKETIEEMITTKTEEYELDFNSIF